MRHKAQIPTIDRETVESLSILFDRAGVDGVRLLERAEVGKLRIHINGGQLSLRELRKLVLRVEGRSSPLRRP